MIYKLIAVGLMLGLMGCSAVELQNRNQQATETVNAQIESTVVSRLATQSGDKPTIETPADGAMLEGDLTLTWTYTRTLSPNEYFRIWMAPDGFPLRPIDTSQQPTIDISNFVSENPADGYRWQIQVVRLDANGEIADITALPSDIATFRVAGVESVDVTATLASIYTQATREAETIDEQIAATLTAIVERTEEPIAETTVDPEATAEVDNTPLPTSAVVTVYGTVPVDSDSLNSITALAFDSDGQLLVSLRAGDIYRLIDNDNDDEADDVILIFEDNNDDIGQVTGLFSDGGALYIVNGSQLSQLQDTDNDGIYETVTQLSDDLPANQALLQANNGIIRAPDGRYFTVDVVTGDVLLITLTG